MPLVSAQLLIPWIWRIAPGLEATHPRLSGPLFSYRTASPSRSSPRSESFRLWRSASTCGAGMAPSLMDASTPNRSRNGAQQQQQQHSLVLPHAP